MTALSAPSVPIDLFKAAPTPTNGQTREQIRATAKDFETSFLTVMFGQMFEGVDGGEFGGGHGESMFKSFMLDAFAKQMTRAGGVGLSASVEREMLKLQGLEE